MPCTIRGICSSSIPTTRKAIDGMHSAVWPYSLTTSSIFVCTGSRAMRISSKMTERRAEKRGSDVGAGTNRLLVGVLHDASSIEMQDESSDAGRPSGPPAKAGVCVRSAANERIIVLLCSTSSDCDPHALTLQ
eukprot:scaffold270841_cov36-Tisochrysis_lutea.AAC.2